ncbi:MAG: hypothetical protein SGARI_004590 [Bacillariaceae sp.]
MNSVGKADGDEDPLAQLKAEAHEAELLSKEKNNRKLSQEEIQALESGMTGGGGKYGANVQVAVAAPADIAVLEEEANMKVFRAKQQEISGEDGKKKKPWWRFGF